MIRTLICEDQQRFRRVLRRALEAEPDLQVAGEAPDGEEACRLVRAVATEVLLLDLELPGMNGLEVVRTLRPERPELEILILTSFADEDRVFEAMRLGAAGYLVKGGAPSRIGEAIRQVVAGGCVIEPRLARRFWNLFVAEQGRSRETYGLTSDELEVLTLVARGLSNPEAARALGASRRAVKAHLESIYRKLGVQSRVQASVLALQAGLITL